jgi:putative FmdB family regulatory protein
LKIWRRPIRCRSRKLVSLRGRSMPFYEYECSACSHQVEVLQKISDAPLSKCPDCGEPALKRLMSAPVFRLKGAGWYETDFKSENEQKRNIAEREEPKAEDKAEGKAEAKPAEAEKGSDAKPAETAKSTETRGDSAKAKAESKPEPRSVPKPVKVSAASGKSHAAPAKAKVAASKGKAKAGKAKSVVKKKVRRR